MNDIDYVLQIVHRVDWLNAVAATPGICKKPNENDGIFENLQ